MIARRVIVKKYLILDILILIGLLGGYCKAGPKIPDDEMPLGVWICYSEDSVDADMFAELKDSLHINFAEKVAVYNDKTNNILTANNNDLY
jgi:hypothetical protein